MAQDNPYADLGAQEVVPPSNPYSDLGAVPSAPDKPFAELGGKVDTTPETLDPELVKRIEASGVSPEEARKRAKRAQDLLREGGTVIRQGTNEYGDAGSTIGAFFEGLARGYDPTSVTSLIPGFGDTSLADVGERTLGMIPGLPLTQADIEARKRENPRAEAAGAVVGAMLDPLAWVTNAIAPAKFATALRTVSKIPGVGGLASEVLRGAKELEAGAEVASRVGAARQAARQGTTVGKVEAEVAGQLERLRAARAVGTELTQEELKLLNTAETLSKPGPIAETAARVTRKPVSRKAEERYVRDEARRVLATRMADNYRNMGWEGRLGQAGADALDAALASGAGSVVSSIPRVGNIIIKGTALDSNLSEQDAKVMSEHLASQLLTDIAGSVAINTALGAATPMIVTAVSEGIRGLRFASSKLASKLYPKLGSMTGVAELEDIRKGLSVAEAAADVDIAPELTKFRSNAQYQYDNIESFYDQVLSSESSVIDDIRAAGLGPRADVLQAELASIGDEVRAARADLRRQFMTKKDDGSYRYNIGLEKAVKESPIQVTRDPTTNQVVSVDFDYPEPLERLQNALGRLERFIVDVEGAPPSSSFYRPDLATRPRPGMTTPFSDMGEDIPSLPILGRERLLPPEPLSLGLPKAAIRNPLVLSYNENLIGARLPEVQPLSPLLGYAVSAGLGAGAGYLAEKADEGLGIPVGLGTAGLAVGGRFAYNLMYNQKALVNNYAAAQMWGAQVNRALDTAAISIVRNPGVVTKLTGAAERKTNIGGVASRNVFGMMPPTPEDSIEGARDRFEADRAWLTDLTGPDAIGKSTALFGSEMSRVDAAYPRLAADASMVTPRAALFLKQKMDSIFQPKDNAYADIKPDRRQIYEYGQYSRYVRNIDVIFDDIESKKYVPDAAVEVLGKVYPANYASLKMKILDQIVEARKAGEKIDPKQMRSVEKLLGMSVSGFTATQIRTLQKTFEKSASSGEGPVSPRRIELEREGTTAE